MSTKHVVIVVHDTAIPISGFLGRICVCISGGDGEVGVEREGEGRKGTEGRGWTLLMLLEHFSS